MNILVAADNQLIPGVARLYLADREKHDELAAELTRRFTSDLGESDTSAIRIADILSF